MTSQQLEREAAWMRYRYARGPMPEPLPVPALPVERIGDHEPAEIAEWERWA